MHDSARYLILGGGAVVSEFHLPAFAKLGWLNRARVADPSPGARDTISRAFPDVEVVRSDFREAIRSARDSGFNAAIVALPNALHEEAVDLGLDVGLDVLCEKPLALTHAVCARLTEKAETSTRLLAVGMVRRLAPAVQAARKAIGAGWIGEVQSAEISWGGPFAWPSDSGQYFKPENAGVLANLGVHSLDLVEHLFGTLEPLAYTDDWAGGAEANAKFRLRTATGASITIALSYTTQLANEIRIRGTKGDLWFDHEGPRVFLRDAQTGLDAVVVANRPFLYGDWPPTLMSCFAEQIAVFDNAIRAGSTPHATGRDAVRTATLIDWAYQHHQSPRSSRHTHALLPKGRIVVTGGTGFVGGHLVDGLVSQGHEDVKVIVRSHRSGANAGRFPVQMVRTDLLDFTAVCDAMSGARYVFHLAYGRDGQDATRATLEGTRSVVNAAVAAGAEAVVVLSTTALFGKDDVCVDESSPYAPTNQYERQKAEAEQWALERARDVTGTRIAVVNAACVYGPGGSAFTELPARFLLNGTFCWIDNGRGVVNHVYVANLVDAMFLTATCEAAHGERFIVCDGSMTWRAFLVELLGPEADAAASYTREELMALHRSSEPGSRDLAKAILTNPELWRVVRENPHFAKVKAAAKSAWPRLSRRVRAIKDAPRETGAAGRAIPPSWLANLYGPAKTRVTSAKARRLLGWTPRVDTDTALALSRGWLLDMGLLKHNAES